jgi:hypothetical protein
MIKKIAAVLAAVIAVVLVLATTKPNTFEVQRSATVSAPPDSVWPYLDDFHRWRAWSPWEGLDPAMTRTFSGADSGAGAIYAWSGNKKVGTGRMEITGAQSPSTLTIALDFLTPFESHNTTVFSLRPSGDSTVVTWTMTGPNTYFGKVMSVFVSMDRLVGKDFEAGLANLKTVVEH